MSITPSSITSKTEWFRVLATGGIGNSWQPYGPVEEWRAKGRPGDLLCLRENRPGGRCYYNLTPEEVEGLIAFHADCEWASVSPMCPSCETLNAEVMRGVFGLEVRYAEGVGTMRAAMARASHASGLKAQLLLQKHLDAASYDDLTEILDLYPDHVVELTAFAWSIGSCGNRNTVIWEVRRY